MSRAKLIKSIGEVLLRLDSLRKGQAIDEKARSAVNDMRSALAKQQMLLAIGDFQESAGFRDAADAIGALSAELCQTMDRAETSMFPVNNLERVVSAVDALLKREYYF